MINFEAEWNEVAQTLPMSGIKQVEANLPFTTYVAIIDNCRGVVVATDKQVVLRVQAFESYGLIFKRFEQGSKKGLMLLQRAPHREEFMLFLEDLLDPKHYSIDLDVSMAIAQFSAIVLKWKRCFMQIGDATYFDLKGLFGEMTFVNNLLSSGVDADRILTAWRIDRERYRVDFEFMDKCVEVEVKAIEQGTDREIKISSIEQLTNSPGIQLFLAVFAIESGVGITINELFNSINARLATKVTQDNLAELFFGYGLPPRLMKNYDDQKFRVSSVQFYNVAGTFPRMHRNIIPPAISSATYEITVNQIPHETITKFENLLREVQIG